MVTAKSIGFEANGDWGAQTPQFEQKQPKVNCAVVLTRNEARARALELLKAFGTNSLSFQIMQSEFELWFAREHGCVAYADTGKAWIAAGPPIAADTDLHAVALQFAEAAREHSRRVAFFGVEDRFTADRRFKAVLVGHQTVIDTRRWHDALADRATLRAQLRRARNKGIRVTPVEWTELVDTRNPVRRRMEELGASWQRSKPMPEMGFLAQLQPLLFNSERKFYVAQHREQAVGFAALDPVYRRRGWALQHLVRAPNAPNGTAEILIDTAIRHAAEANVEYFALGLTPLAGAVGPWLSLARSVCTPLYDFKGLERFRSKFPAHHQVPIYLAYPRAGSAQSAIVDCLVAFARGNLWRFGMQTIRHRLKGLAGPFPLQPELDSITRGASRAWQ